MGKSGPQQLILLLGNRLQPATMLAYHLRPARVACIGSADRAETLDEVQNAIEHLLGPGRLAGERMVAPYRLDATLAAIDELTAGLPGLPPMIGLTGCPLPMSIAGYEAGRRLGCPVLYVNTAGAEIVDFTRPDQLEPLRVRFDVKDYLAICGLQAVTGRKPRYLSTPEERTAAARLLGGAGGSGATLIAALREAGLVHGRIRRLRGDAFDANGRTLLRQLVAQRIVTDLTELSGELITYRIPTAGEQAFLNGDWLEDYVWDVAQRLRSQEPDLFDAADIRVAFRSSDAAREADLISRNKLREIDFIALHGGVPLIASCKTGADPWQKEDLDELAAIAQLLGGNYVTRLFITNQKPPPSPHPHADDSHRQFQEQARRQRIVLVTGQQIGGLAEILHDEIRNPTFKSL